MKKRYLVTGASGFVGSWITRTLVEKGEDVSIIVRNKNSIRLKDLKNKLQIYECDLKSLQLEKVIDVIKPNVVFHLAASGATPSKVNGFDEFLDSNVKGVAHLLEAVKKHNLHLFVNTGSSSEYGIKSKSMHEDDVLAPINDYGVTKAAATLYCQKVAKVENLPIVTLRLFSPYGYNDDITRLVSYVIERSLKNQPIHLSSKQNVRDFIYIEDVVDAYLKVVTANVAPGEIINIGSGKQHSVSDIVTHIVDLTQSTSPIEWGAMPPQARQKEPKIWQADITKAQKLLEWIPRHSLKQGLQKTIAYYKDTL